MCPSKHFEFQLRGCNLKLSEVRSGPFGFYFGLPDEVVPESSLDRLPHCFTRGRRIIQQPWMYIGLRVDSGSNFGLSQAEVLL